MKLKEYTVRIDNEEYEWLETFYALDDDDLDNDIFEKYGAYISYEIVKKVSAY